MSERYGSSRPPRRDYDERPRQSGQRPSGAGHKSNSRYSQNGRPASRPPQNGRPASRPPQNGRRPAPKRRKKSAAPTIILIVVILLVILAAVIIVPKLLNNKPDVSATNAGSVSTVTQNNIAEVTAAPDSAVSSGDSDALQAYLAGEDNGMQGLTSEQLVQVSDLSINESLPEEWMNILLLGTDGRSTTESARSDTMMICSINKNTGEVKLTSIMRDLAIEMDDLGEDSGTYRINAANFFGGPQYAMKVVNECFDMNIQHFVSINFFGFQEIAHALGGITVDITKEEMTEINYLVWTAHVAAEKAGMDENRLPLVELKDFGEDVQLDGRQTLAYARLRKLDNDYARSGRQREVLSKLATKLKEKSPAEIMMMLSGFVPYVSTNMEITEGIGIAMQVLQGDVGNIESFRLPINNSYDLETQNEKSMMYNCDWAINARDLYTFIYS